MFFLSTGTMIATHLKVLLLLTSNVKIASDYMTMATTLLKLPAVAAETAKIYAELAEINPICQPDSNLDDAASSTEQVQKVEHKWHCAFKKAGTIGMQVFQAAQRRCANQRLAAACSEEFQSLRKKALDLGPLTCNVLTTTMQDVAASAEKVKPLVADLNKLKARAVD